MSPATVLADTTTPQALPDANASSLALVHPTPEEKQAIIRQNAVAWRGPLEISAYLEREKYLFNQALTRDGGITHWALVDTDEPLESRRVLSSCESIRKKALLAVTAEDGSVCVEEVLSHGIGSVFCEPGLRGRGYAGRMMREMGTVLRTWQVDERLQGRQRCLFSVLFSDIGKKFYASHGWHPFPSSHVALPPIPDGQQIERSRLPASRELRVEDLAALCRADEDLIRRELQTPDSAHRSKVALIPDTQTMSWHHAREEFVAQRVFNRKPEIKGAIVGDQPGSRAWCVWVRVWGDDLEARNADNKLYILRMVVEGENAEKRTANGTDAASAGEHTGNDTHQRDMITSLLLAAQAEASKWGLKEVHIWNPTQQAITAAQQAHDLSAPWSNSTAVELVDRDSDSITSLMWYGDADDDAARDRRADVEWIGNEKYGWC